MPVREIEVDGGRPGAPGRDRPRGAPTSGCPSTAAGSTASRVTVTEVAGSDGVVAIREHRAPGRRARPAAGGAGHGRRRGHGLRLPGPPASSRLHRRRPRDGVRRREPGPPERGAGRDLPGDHRAPRTAPGSSRGRWWPLPADSTQRLLAADQQEGAGTGVLDVRRRAGRRRADGVRRRPVDVLDADARDGEPDPDPDLAGATVHQRAADRRRHAGRQWPPPTWCCAPATRSATWTSGSVAVGSSRWPPTSSRSSSTAPRRWAASSAVGDLALRGLDDLGVRIDKDRATGALCGLGPELEVDGKVYRTAVTRHRRGRPRRAARWPCAAAPARSRWSRARTASRCGRRASSRPPWSNLRADAAERAAAGPRRTVEIGRWDSNDRTLELGAGPESVLVVHENVNAGWEATARRRGCSTPCGSTAGSRATSCPPARVARSRLTFAPDRLYRLALLAGAVVAALLVVGALGLAAPGPGLRVAGALDRPLPGGACAALAGAAARPRPRRPARWPGVRRRRAAGRDRPTLDAARACSARRWWRSRVSRREWSPPPRPGCRRRGLMLSPASGSVARWPPSCCTARPVPVARKEPRRDLDARTAFRAGAGTGARTRRRAAGAGAVAGPARAPRARPDRRPGRVARVCSSAAASSPRTTSSMFARSNTSLSADLLTQDYAGHLFPGGFLFSWVAAHHAPLDWGVAACRDRRAAGRRGGSRLAGAVPDAAGAVGAGCRSSRCTCSARSPWSPRSGGRWRSSSSRSRCSCCSPSGRSWPACRTAAAGRRPSSSWRRCSAWCSRSARCSTPSCSASWRSGLATTRTRRRGRSAARCATTSACGPRWSSSSAAYLFWHREAAPIESSSAGSSGDNVALVGNFFFRNLFPGLAGGPWHPEVLGNSLVYPPDWAVGRAARRWWCCWRCGRWCAAAPRP